MKPAWEAFGKAVMKEWPESGLDGFDLQDLAEKHGLIEIIPGGFNPLVHVDQFGCADPGDKWFERNYK